MSVSLYLESNYRQATNKTMRYLTVWEGKLYKQKIYDSDPQHCCNKGIWFEWHLLNSNKKLETHSTTRDIINIYFSFGYQFWVMPQTSFEGKERNVGSPPYINLKHRSLAFSALFFCRQRQGIHFCYSWGKLLCS